MIQKQDSPSRVPSSTPKHVRAHCGGGRRRRSRPHAITLANLVLLAALIPSDLWATTVVPPPFDWVNNLIIYIRGAAIPFTVLMLMICAIAWVPAKNGEGIVAFGGRALIALTVILWGGVFITILGFQGAVV
jgi:hypothetical protein